MFSRGMKGAMKIGATILFAMSFFSLTAYFLYNSLNAIAQVETTNTNNITLVELASSIETVTLKSLDNNTEWKSNVPFGINVSIMNSSALHGGGDFSNTSVQYVDAVFWNTSGGFTTFRLTNGTFNKSHTFYFNNTLFGFNSFFSSANGRGNYRNLTIRAYNITGGFEWLNDSVPHTPINFSIVELRSNALISTVEAPTNSSNFTSSSPFDLNITSNETFSFGGFVVGNGTAYKTILTLYNASFNNSRSAHNTTNIGWENSVFNAFENITYFTEDAFGNRSWLNSSAGHKPYQFRIDTLSPVVGPVYLQIYNATRGDYDRNVNVTINGSSTFTNNTNNSIPGMTFPLERALSVSFFGNNSFTFTAANYTLTNYTHLNVTVKCPAGGCDMTLTYNVTFVRDSQVSVKGIQGNFVNITWFVADNNTMNSTVEVVDSRNGTWTILGTRYKDATPTSNNTWTTNLTGNMSVVQGTGVKIIPDGRFSTVARADDYARNTVSSNSTFVASNLTGSKQNLIVWYNNLILSEIIRWLPNATHVSTFNNLANWKNFTTHASGNSVNANGYVNESLNATYVRVSENNFLIRYWNAGGTSFRNTNHTTQTLGWNLIGVRTIIHNLNNTLYDNSNSTYSNSTATEGVYLPGQSANVTHVSIYNSTLGKFCTLKRGLSITSCSPQFNSTDITVPMGYGLWIRFNINMTANITNIGEYRA